MPQTGHQQVLEYSQPAKTQQYPMQNSLLYNLYFRYNQGQPAVQRTQGAGSSSQVVLVVTTLYHHYMYMVHFISLL